VVGPVDLDAVPAVLLDPDLSPGDPLEVVGEVAPQAQPEVLDLAHPVLLGEGVDGVLLGVGGDHVRVVAAGVGGGEVAPQRGGHAEVLELVPVAVPGDVDQANLGLAVLVVAERDGHG
jgi:hypothetical protein